MKCATTTELTEETSSGLKRDKISWNKIGRKFDIDPSIDISTVS